MVKDKIFILLAISFIFILPISSAFNFPSNDMRISTYFGNLTNLSEMADVNIPTPSDLDFLQFQSATNKWNAYTFDLNDFWDFDYGDLINNPTSLSDFINDLTVASFTNDLGFWNDTFATFNKTYADTLYTNITWNYNQTEATINILNGTGLIKDWNSTGYIKDWNSSGLIKDWNSTGLIINWSNVITAGSIFDQDLNTTDNVTFANVTADYFFGDGSQLTGISSGSLTGSGISNYIPLWNGTTSLNNSVISQSGTAIKIAGSIYASDNFKWNDTNGSILVGTLTGNTLLGVTTFGFLTGYLNTGGGLTAIGSGSAYGNTGINVVGIGQTSVQGNKGSFVTASGYQSAYLNNGSYVIAIGPYSAQINIGNYSSALGYQSSYNNSGNNVVAIGYQAGKDNTASNKFILQQANVNANPLIYGDFATGQVNVSGSLYVNGQLVGAGSISSNGTANYISKFVNSTYLTNSSIYESGGKVGIGTSNPSVQLEVVGSTKASLSVLASGGNAKLASDAIWGNYNGLLTFGNLYPSSNSVLAIYTNATEQMRINSEGNIGIGTTNPGGKLHIVSNAPSSTILNIWNSAHTGSILQFNEDASGNGYLQLRNATDTTKISLNSAGNSYFNVGNVGIGTTTPQNKLNVIGNGNFTGNLYSNGNLTIGANTPSYPLFVNTSVSGISAYFLGNISVEDVVYHSPYANDSYSNKQALEDILKVKGSNGKINYSSVPKNAISYQEIPIYNITTIQVEKTIQEPVMENITYTEEICDYEKQLLSNKYNYVCENTTHIEEQQKQECHNETKYKFEEAKEIKEVCEELFNEILNETTQSCHNEEIGLGYFEKIGYEEVVCSSIYENITILESQSINTEIGKRTEPQVSFGYMISNIIKSIQELFDLNTKQDDEISSLKTENQLIKTELCKKDNSYDWCKIK